MMPLIGESLDFGFYFFKQQFEASLEQFYIVSFLKHLISVAFNSFRMSAVNVQVSQAYNSTEITRGRISLIVALREICLSFQLVLILLVLLLSLHFCTVL